MATKPYLTVDGVYSTEKDSFLTVNSVYRRVKKAFKTVNGVYRLCYDSSELDPVFENNTWEQIAYACQTNSVPDTWAVGDKKESGLSNTRGVEVKVYIIGKNHDTYENGEKAPLTFMFPPTLKRAYDLSGENILNTGGYLDDSYTALKTNDWTNCTMRTTYLPEILEYLPDYFKNNIRPVKKLTGKSSDPDSLVETFDTLFPISLTEAFGFDEVPNTAANLAEGEQYEYFKQDGALSQMLTSTIYGGGWLRSPAYSTYGYWYYAGMNSNYVVQGFTDKPNQNYAVYPAFCF